MFCKVFYPWAVFQSVNLLWRKKTSNFYIETVPSIVICIVEVSLYHHPPVFKTFFARFVWFTLAYVKIYG